MVKNNQDNIFNENKSTNLDSSTMNRKSNPDEEVCDKKFIADEMDKNTILRFNQTLENYLKVSVGNNTYNISKYDEIQITGSTIIKAPNSGRYLLQNWNTKCKDKNSNAKIRNFIKSTKTNSPTGNSGAMSLAPIEDSFIYIERSSYNHG